MAAKTRIYRVDGPDRVRLVEAATVNGAVAHVAKSIIKASLATQQDLYEAGKAGVEVEVVGQDQSQGSLPLGGEGGQQ